MKTLKNKNVVRLLILISLIVVIGVSFIVTTAVYKGTHIGSGSLVLDKGIFIDISDVSSGELSKNMEMPIQYYLDKVTSETNRVQFSVKPSSESEYYIANPTITAQDSSQAFYLRLKLNAQYYVNGSSTPTTFSMSASEKNTLFQLFATDSNYSPVLFNDCFAADANGEYYYYVSGGYGVATKNNLAQVTSGMEISLFKGFLANGTTPVSVINFREFENVPENVTNITLSLDVELALEPNNWNLPDVTLLTENDVTVSLVDNEYEITKINTSATTYALPGYYQGKAITRIGTTTPSALDDDAVTVWFANTMTHVGGYRGVSTLQKIYLGNNVSEICDSAFGYSGLTGNLVLPISIQKIGKESLGNLNTTGLFPYIPNCMSYGLGAFQNDAGFTGTLTIRGLISEHAFKAMEGIETLKISSDTTLLGSDSWSDNFRDMSSLKKVIIDSSAVAGLASSGSGLLENENLTDVYIKSDLTIGAYFANHSNFVETESNVAGYRHFGRSYQLTFDGGNIDGTLDAKFWNYAGSAGYSSLNTGNNGKYSFSGKNATTKIGINGVNAFYLPMPIISGYTFDGWYTTANGSSETVKVATADGWIANVSGYTSENGSWIRASATTLYAHYAKKEYAIDYDFAGGTKGTNAPSSYIFGNTTAISNPTRTGYLFTGWNISVSLTGRSLATININTGVQEYAESYPNAVYYELFYAHQGISYTAALSGDQIRWRGYTTAGAFKGNVSTSSQYAPTYNMYVALWYHLGKKDNNTIYTYDYTGGNFSIDSLQVGNLTLTAKWTPITYTIKYDGNGNTSGSTASSSHTYDQAKALTANGFVKTGYTFAGWATSAAGAVVYTNKQSVKNLSSTQGATVTLYAKWTPITYTIQYNGNGSTSGSTANSSHTYDQAKALTANGFVKTGYTFAGWATSATGAVVYTNKQSVKNLSSTQGATVTLYAKWTANTYAVTFDSLLSLGAGSVDSSSWSISNGEFIMTSAGGNGGYIYGFTDHMTNGVRYRITIQAKASKAITLPMNYEAGGSKNISLTTSYQTYYIDYTYNSSATYSALTFYSSNWNSGDKLYVKNITLSRLVIYDSTYGTLPTPLREGYTFDGWYTASSGGTKVASSTKVTITENQTLYAHWTENRLIIKYHLNGGTDVANDNNFQSGDPCLTQKWPYTFTTEYGLTNYNITSRVVRTGYLANTYYNTKADGTGYNLDHDALKTTIQIAEAAHVLADLEKGNVEIDIYMIWTPITYTIQYNGNGNTSGSTANSSHTYDQAKALTANGFAKTGYTFAGWSKYKLTGEGECIYQYFDQESVKNLSTTNNEKVVLYALWRHNSSYLTRSWATILSNNSCAKTNIKTITFTNTLPSGSGYRIVSVGATSAIGGTWSSGYAVFDVKAYIKRNSSDSSKNDVIFYSPVTIFAPNNSNTLFSGLTNVVSIVFNNFNTTTCSTGTGNMDYMFSECSALTSLDLTSFNTSNSIGLRGLFSGCSSLISVKLTSFNTSKVKDVEYLFNGCSSLQSLNLSNFDFSSITKATNFFKGCSALTTINTPKAISSSITIDLPSTANKHWANQSNASQIYVNISSSNINMTLILKNNSSYLLTGTNWQQALINANSNYTQANILNITFTNILPTQGTTVSVGATTSAGTTKFSSSTLGVSDIIAYVTASSVSGKYDVVFYSPVIIYAPADSSWLFSSTTTSKRLTNLKSITFNNFNTTNVTNMKLMFLYCSSLSKLTLTMFQTTNVTNMCGIFSNCTSLTSVDISSFKTSKVTDMSSMFSNCSSLKSLNVSNLDTRNVYNMSSMFSKCSSLTSLNVSKFNMSKVTYIGSMFSDCSKLTTIDLSNFDLSVVNTTSSCFSGCTSLKTIKTPKKINSGYSLPLPYLEGRWYNGSSGPLFNITSSMTSITVTLKNSFTLYNLGNYALLKRTSSKLGGSIGVLSGTAITIYWGDVIEITSNAGRVLLDTHYYSKYAYIKCNYFKTSTANTAVDSEMKNKVHQVYAGTFTVYGDITITSALQEEYRLVWSGSTSTGWIRNGSRSIMPDLWGIQAYDMISSGYKYKVSGNVTFGSKSNQSGSNGFTQVSSWSGGTVHASWWADWSISLSTGGVSFTGSNMGAYYGKGYITEVYIYY